MRQQMTERRERGKEASFSYYERKLSPLDSVSIADSVITDRMYRLSHGLLYIMTERRTRQRCKSRGC